MQVWDPQIIQESKKPDLNAEDFFLLLDIKMCST